ncbi:MAG: rhodanese-like domain-containing protein [Phycisphaeraceae bacterium]
MQTITAHELKDQLEQTNGSARLLDVRTFPEHRAVHVRGAKLMPLDKLDPERVRETFPGDAPIHVLCKSGQRASKACDKLAHSGLSNLVLVEGGTDAAVEAGLPVERGRKSIDLIRQVHIVAGSFTLLGTLLGVFVSPWFLLIPGFFGAGLTFAGATGMCGLAMLLSRMPWNGAPATSCSTPQPA